MPEFVFVKPAEGARVRQPDRNSTVMPAEGAVVARTVYYERLIMTGELVIDEGKTAEYSLEQRAQREREAKAPKKDEPPAEAKAAEAPPKEQPRALPRTSK